MKAMLSPKSTSNGQRLGVTILELLAVLLVVSILTGMVLFALQGAQKDAVAARTRATLQKIHEVLAVRWAEYVANPAKVGIPEEVRLNATPREIARVQLHATRDLMRMELPDRTGDLFEPAIPILVGTTQFQVSVDVPPTAIAMQNRVMRATPRSGDWRDWDEDNQVAELLYLILESTNVNGSPAISSFRESEIGDTDGDNLLEFIDGWGNPIAFIRWPVGYSASRGPMSDFDPFLYEQITYMNDIPTFGSSRRDAKGRTVLTSLPSANFRGSDPIDFGLADWGYQIKDANNNFPWQQDVGLFPLVISSGPDGEFGIQFDLPTYGTVDRGTDDTQGQRGYGNIAWNYTNGPQLAASYLDANSRAFVVDPYHPRVPVPSDGSIRWVGQVIPAEAAFADDNVTSFDDFGG